MKKVTFTGVVNKKPIKEIVYVSDKIGIPYFIEHPTSGQTLKRVSKPIEFTGNPPKGSIVIRELTSEELSELASKEADSILSDLEKNPGAFENSEDLKSFSKKHWEKQAKKAFLSIGKVEIV